MAENRNITWEVTLIADASKVSPQYTLNLTSSNLDYGKWAQNPPSQIEISAGDTQTSVSFMAEGAECSATGTSGSVTYTSSDNSTTFTFTFDIPYSSANSGNVTGGSANYQLDNGGGVPASGNSVSVNVLITQIAPVV